MSAIPWRGVVEGFYGEPWTQAQRERFLSSAVEWGYEHYVYAPKFDAYHRDRWRELYPDDALAEVAELAAMATRYGVEFVWSIAPGLSMRYADDQDHALLLAKAEQLWDAGVRGFAILFDDVPIELEDPRDRAVFGAEEGDSGAAHGEACARFGRDFLTPHGIDDPLLVCPTDYAGSGRSRYRERLAERLPADARIFWTGPDIVVGEITREDIDAAADSFDRDLVLWDNFPVNDFDRSRIFVGPLVGRTRDVAGSRLVGFAPNPMPEAAASLFSLRAAAEWGRDPGSYDPEAARRRSWQEIAADGLTGLEPLLNACSSWPPGDPADPVLEEWVEAALAGDQDAIARTRGRFSELADTESGEAPDDVRLGLEPWVRSAKDVGAAGVLACDVLSGRADVEDLGAARELALGHEAAVLRVALTRLLDGASAGANGERSR
jgi:hypothetical protein